jgi:hypothetical protein
LRALVMGMHCTRSYFTTQMHLEICVLSRKRKHTSNSSNKIRRNRLRILQPAKQVSCKEWGMFDRRWRYAITQQAQINVSEDIDVVGEKGTRQILNG